MVSQFLLSFMLSRKPNLTRFFRDRNTPGFNEKKIHFVIVTFMFWIILELFCFDSVGEIWRPSNVFGISRN